MVLNVDFEQVLKLEPTNKQGAAELKIAQKLNEVHILL